VWSAEREWIWAPYMETEVGSPWIAPFHGEPVRGQRGGGGGRVELGREGGVGWRGRARTVAEPCGEAVDAHDIGL
jgi:hypothetical protein